MKHTTKLIYKNFVLFSIGYFLYIIIELCFRGYSYPISGIMGGLSLIIIDKFNDYISWDIDFILQCILGACVVTTIELIFGLIDINYLHLNMWDYSNMPLNYKGIICLPFSIIWCFLSGIGIIIADINNYYFLDYKDEIPYYKIFGKVIYKFA